MLSTLSTLKNRFLIILLLAAACGARAQEATGYYRLPLDGAPQLSSNFGEMRPGHFHSGVDFRTDGREGLKVYAVADGYVSRVGVVPRGYGRVLYVTHPNGTVSVYGHLSRFAPAIEQYAANQRYNARKHTLDAELHSNQFRVRKGDVIGYSGNSGISYGPHLHFEIRDRAGRPTDPLKTAGYHVPDTIPPTVARMWFVETDTVMNMVRYGQPREIPLRNAGKAVYTLRNELVCEIGGKGYFVVEAFDLRNATANNVMGIPHVTESLDGVKILEYRLANFAFADTRMVDLVSYYPFQRNSRYEIFRLAVAGGNKLEVYPRMVNRGIVNITDSLIHKLRIELEDDSGNASRVEFDLVRKGEGLMKIHTGINGNGEKVTYDRFSPPNATSEGIPVSHNTEFVCRRGSMRVLIPVGALYESTFLKIREAEGVVPDTLATKVSLASPIYTVGNPDIPLKSSFKIEITPGNSSPHTVLAHIDDKGGMSWAGSDIKNGSVTAPVRNFGHYAAVVDSIPPRITPRFAEGQPFGAGKELSFKIEDNFSGIDSFYGTIDGKWILFEQDVVRGTIAHTLTERTPSTGASHTLILTVLDRAANATTVTMRFVH